MNIINIPLLTWLEHTLFAFCIVVLIRIWVNEGPQGLNLALLNAIKKFPGVEGLIQSILKKEVHSFMKTMNTTETDIKKPAKVAIPEKGIPHEELLKEMKKIKAGDVAPEDGKIFAYVYTAEDDNFELQCKAYDMFTENTGVSADHDMVVREFHHAFMHENALNPMVFPSLRRFENEVISMTAAMLNGDQNVVGSLTSGGTESILMAMKTYRDRARKQYPQIKHPEMVAPITIHPAHEKAAQYFGFKIVHIPIGKDFKPDLVKYEDAINPNTITLLSSAPQYCHGIVDPIEQISEIAERRGLPLHVDACFGGYMLPWVEKLGYKLPKFDFRSPGVTSMSADIHKYGYGAKGASVVLYRDEEIRKHQIFAYSQWPGGFFGSPSMAGTRPGGNIAGSWATMQSMGQDGYLRMAKKLMDTTNKLKDGINEIPGLCILGDPKMTAFAIGSNDKDIPMLVLADVMEEKGWKVERQMNPDCLHCTILPHHLGVVDKLLDALAKSAQEVKNNPGLKKKGTAAMYGMVSKIPDKRLVDDFIVEFFSEVYKA